MIKQIQLRGISHKPSDRLTADGGLEDCIDLRLEEQEHASAKAPENVTDTLAPGLSDAGMDVIYIHKTNSYTNYIGVKKSGGHNYLYAYHKVADTWSLQQIVQLPEDEYPKGITSMGNIVIATVDTGSLYALYKDNEYEYLGDRIPEPKVVIYADPVTGTLSKQTNIYLSQKYPALANAYRESTPLQFWTAVLGYVGQSGNEISSQANDFYEDVCNTIWAGVDTEKKNQASDNVFLFPTLARYALRLTNGSYIYQSSLILLAGGTDNECQDVNCNMAVEQAQSGWMVTWRILDTFHNPYTATVSVEENSDLEKWKDIVDSLDVFLSTDIRVPRHGAKAGEGTETGSHGPIFDYSDIVLSFDGEPDNTREAFEKQIEEKGNFYRVLSIPWANVSGASKDLAPHMQDDLVVLPRLPENFPHMVDGLDGLRTYNNRLVLAGDRVTLSSGYFAPNAYEGIPPGSGGYDMAAMVFFVRVNDGVEKHVFSFKDFYTMGESHVRAFVSYPDERCFLAYYYHVTTGGQYYLYTLPMKKHPLLNCAYGFWGIDQILGSEETYTEDDRTAEGDIHAYGISDDRTFDEANRVRLSELDSPFAYSIGQQFTFSAKVLDVVPVTIALSTGQYGQFPLYVFTEDGIWTVSLNDEGEVLATHPVSRDVAYQGSIAQLDQAIVFISRQGVMLLSGSDTSLLSPYMDGPRYELEDVLPDGSAIRAALSASGWGSLIDIALDTTDFRDFIDGCRPLYDYANRRILFFNEEEDYAYEYALDSQTWHRLSVPEKFVRALNGYPQSFAVMGDDIYEWSVQQEYNEETPQARKGIILTRAMDLGDPDIRKVVHDLRIRGTFNRGDIKYLMFGSSDGIHWHRLLTKGGGSYNLFRFLILANMTPGERISWIDVEYDRRFLNKLR